MTTRTPLPELPRELAHRTGDGLEIYLRWDPGTGAVTVSVEDARNDEVVEVAVGDAAALDVFEHPYAYAAREGIPYRGARTVAAVRDIESGDGPARPTRAV